MKFLYPLFATLSGILLIACSNQYQVVGTTSIHEMEGSTMYLKTFQDKSMKTLDSCTVTHGKFHFSGMVDSVVMANLFVNDEGGMPVVLEGSNVSIKIDELEQTVSGSPLNDSLYHFIQHKSQYDNQLSELPEREGRMVMDGIDHDEVMRILNQQAMTLISKRDRLETNFIKSNYNNVLGPGVFMIMTSNYDYPILTPQIEELLTNATPYFLNHPYVNEYVKAAQENMERMQAQ